MPAMLLRLVNQEAEGVRVKTLVAALISGVANAGVLAIVSAAAREGSSTSASLGIAFLLACALYAVGYRACVSMLTGTFEQALYQVRLRIADKIRQAELGGLERIGASEIYERLTQETSVISQASWALAGCLQSAVMGVIMSLYLAKIDQTAFLLALALYGIGGYIYFLRRQAADGFLRQNASLQMVLLDRLNDLLKGFKELRLRTQRSEDLKRDFQQTAARLNSSMVQTHTFNEGNYVFLYLNLFALLAAIVFVLPQFVPAYSGKLNNLVAASLFMFSSVGNVLFALPQYGRANLAAESIYEIEHKLEQAAGPSPGKTEDPWQGLFSELHAVDLEYSYPRVEGQKSFTVGPLSLTITAGEIVFIIGGNGSGKSTLVKALIGLYQPTAGALYVNGVLVTPSNVQGYRETIAAIFTDFHLFRELYGLGGVSQEEIQRLLQQMQLADKVTITGGRLSTLELSTGQRKRLAMVIALLEDRPLYIFDEWAADQDPEFRQYYYEELLPELKRRGKTVIAISHDDRYFHCADQLVKIEYGQLRSLDRPYHPDLASPDPGLPLDAPGRRQPPR